MMTQPHPKPKLISALSKVSLYDVTVALQLFLLVISGGILFAVCCCSDDVRLLGGSVAASVANQ